VICISTPAESELLLQILGTLIPLYKSGDFLYSAQDHVEMCVRGDDSARSECWLSRVATQENARWDTQGTHFLASLFTDQTKPNLSFNCGFSCADAHQKTARSCDYYLLFTR
jgi:hypothetical protein